MSTTVKNDSFSSGGGGSALAIDYGRVNRYVVHATAGSPGNSMPGCSVANGGASFNYDYVSACPGLDDDFKGKSGTFYVNTSFVGSYSFSQAYIYSASCTLEYVG